MRNVSVATRLVVAVVVVAILALTATTLVGLITGDRLSHELLEARFRANRSSKADEIEGYLESIARQTAVLAASPMTADAAQRFTAGYNALSLTDPDDLQTADEDLLAFYRDEYVPALEAVRGEEVRIREVAPAGPAGVYLQSAFLSDANEFAVAPRAIDDLEDGSAWSEVHAELHPAFRAILDDMAFGDLYLIDPTTRAIVYSVTKAPDFATDLGVGPLSGSTLAALVARITDSPEEGAVLGADFARYAPELDQPVGFLGSPVLDGGELVGILAVQLPADEINRIMTSDGDWASQGLGETGEAYLIGPDDRMRSDSRAYLEDPTAYFAATEAAGTLSPDDARGVAASETTIVFQRADTAALDLATESDQSFVESTNYLGREVFTTVQPIGVPGIDWRLIVQTEREEVDEAFSEFRSNLIVSVALFVMTLTFLAVVWAGRVVRPIRRLTDRLRDESGDAPLEAGSVPEPVGRNVREFNQLSSSIDQMLDSLVEREAALAAASTERLDVARNLLPPEIARRLEAGDRNVVDHVPNATVAAVVVDGLGSLVHTEATTARDLLDRSVDALDALAETHGLERVKLVGDTYFAVCGLNNPYLDHAPRAVAFTLDARDTIEELAAETPTQIDLSAGLQSGPVTAGLTGSTRLIYDLWGATVSSAHFLARSARPGEIIVSDQTKIRLPPDIEVTPREDTSADATAWVVAGVPARTRSSP